MPSTEHLLTFAVLSVVLILVPGPNVMFVITRSLTHGWRAGVATALGGVAGVFVQAVLAAVGVGAIVQESIAVFTIVKFAGAAYLVYLGVKAWRGRHSLAAALNAPVGPEKETRRMLLDAFVVGVANPKVIVFFLAVLPQFADRSAGSVPLQLVVLGAIFCAIAIVCDSLWALLAGSARAWLVRRPQRLAAIGGTGGVVMVGLGVGAALSGRAER